MNVFKFVFICIYIFGLQKITNNIAYLHTIILNKKILFNIIDQYTLI